MKTLAHYEILLRYYKLYANTYNEIIFVLDANR